MPSQHIVRHRDGRRGRIDDFRQSDASRCVPPLRRQDLPHRPFTDRAVETLVFSLSGQTNREPMAKIPDRAGFCAARIFVAHCAGLTMRPSGGADGAIAVDA